MWRTTYCNCHISRPKPLLYANCVIDIPLCYSQTKDKQLPSEIQTPVISTELSYLTDPPDPESSLVKTWISKTDMSDTL